LRSTLAGGCWAFGWLDCALAGRIEQTTRDNAQT
jgi:hypothetical protein